MPTLPRLPNVESRDSPKGRGGFALQSFQSGEVVENCPVIVFQCPHNLLPEELQEYVFDWSDLDVNAPKDMQAIAMGYGGMYKGDNPANMRYEAVIEGAQLLRSIVRPRSDPREFRGVALPNADTGRGRSS